MLKFGSVSLEQYSTRKWNKKQKYKNKNKPHFSKNRNKNKENFKIIKVRIEKKKTVEENKMKRTIYRNLIQLVPVLDNYVRAEQKRKQWNKKRDFLKKGK